MTNEEKERRKVILEYVQKVAERLTNSQSRAMDNLIDKMDKRITKKLEAACRKVAETTMVELKERMEIVKDVERVHDTIRELKMINESLLDKYAFVTEVAYMGRVLLDDKGQANLNKELIRSLDFDADWFRKRNDLSLNELFEIYQNGVKPDVEQ